MKFVFSFLIFLLLGFPNMAQVPTQAEKIYLSGTDVKHPKVWQFKVSDGRKADVWSDINVPSHWEQEGFGTYNYGRDDVSFGKLFKYADEQGCYKTSFTAPNTWKNKEIWIVFEGSMTDTEVKINGELAGKVHQGAFYRFKYNISDKLKWGQSNLLEVKVSKMSAEKTVNNAERLADFWIFGGIFRPVFLEIRPKENIDWMSIDAKANGQFKLKVHLNQKLEGREVIAQILDKQGKQIATTSTIIARNDSTALLQTNVSSPALWTAETPHLYQVKVQLKKGKELLYTTSEKFGFRTIEIRKQDGIYLNGVKIKMKGVNRHVFWPEYGRATFPEGDLTDVKLIKEMNMNAVRCSHYPPDVNFLQLCDSLGLYVIDELTGWQKAYNTKAGEPLVKEMVMRDTNHPSIIFWSNGNEGGHNKDLDNDFSTYDISNRTVIHAHHKPDNAFNGIDCNHYENYYSTQKLLADTNIYMPTEFLHAMHDGGGAAALADFWELHWNAKKGAGGFIWNFADEGIMRTDHQNIIDINGINAPDGVVGPHREKEGSFYAIREIYSPVKISMKELPIDFTGKIPVENRYHFTNLNQCTFRWQLVKFKDKADKESGYTVEKSGIAFAPNVLPTEYGTLQLDLPTDWQTYDGLVLQVSDNQNSELYRWVWKIKSNETLLKPLLQISANQPTTATETDSLIILKANGIAVSFHKNTGKIIRLTNDYSAKLSFTNGPVLVSGTASFAEIKHYPENDAQVVEVQYQGDLKKVRWKMNANGWLEMEYEYTLNGKYPFAGISFNYPEGLVLGAKWLGKGPYRTWKNRPQGITYNVYENLYNNTQTGNAPWIYPEFKGYYANIVWMELSTMEGKFTIASPDDNLFVRLFQFYAINGATPHPTLPIGDISFLDAIPAVGSKMGVSASEVKGLGPSSDLNTLEGTKKRKLLFYFGATPK
ncbi:beta galactosidase small subunit [Arcicella aurantiaca]|uniref:Beta-galactosidase n=1 Tax=Arcicella aurantiaca TaxID=591202 RepID=A0A316E358_9BACT|nr:glycoside hydrolase family 2 TIM barrel-domain containing protein [Arcicella aurantiaca]PWK17330.1 beta galactosidase small subunit [Arcicella aurantiaca]